MSNVPPPAETLAWVGWVFSSSYLGRINRKAYIFKQLGLIGLNLLGSLCLFLVFSSADAAPGLAVLVALPIGCLLFVLFVRGITLVIQRLHDNNMSGWWYLGFVVLGFVPFLNVVTSLVMLVILLFMRGTPGPNRFGEDPLATAPAASHTAPRATPPVFAAQPATRRPAPKSKAKTAAKSKPKATPKAKTSAKGKPTPKSKKK